MMTKAEVIDIIKGKMVEKLMDTTSVKDDINDLFAQWFQGLVQQGMQMTAPPPPPAEGGEAA